MLICVASFISCTNDSDTIVDITDNLPEVKDKIYATFNGLILNETGDLLEGADVMIGGESSVTDENGYFTISGFFNPDGTNLLVEKDGYFDATGRLIPYADVPVNTKIKLIEKASPLKGETNLVISYDTETATVTFAENAFTLEDIKYEGTLEIIGTSIDIQDPEYSQYSPGAMETVKDGAYKILFPYGRVKVELFSESGESLDIDAPAEIRFDIASELAQMAPDEIPLWYLDTDTGLWTEDGIATKSGNQYVGEVSHFTDWCVASDVQLFTLSGTVKRNGEIYAGANMGLTFFSYRFSFKSAEDGSYSARVFNLDNFTLDISDQCNVPIYENSISQLTTDLVQDINIEKSTNSFVVSGTLYCDDLASPVENGYVLVSFDNNQFSEVISSDPSGRFRLFYEDCGNKNISLRAYDSAENKQSRPVDISGDQEDLDINVCAQEIEGSIRIEIDGEEPYIIPGCTVEITDFGDVPGFTYIFRARDNYTFLEDVNGEYADYEILVNVSVPGEIQLPLGPIASPLDLEDGISDNTPFYFQIIPAGSTILSENDESVVLVTADLWPLAIFKVENNITTEHSGKVILEAIKI